MARRVEGTDQRVKVAWGVCSGRGLVLDVAGRGLEVPVAAEQGAARQFEARRDVRASQLGDRVDERRAARADGQFAAVEEKVRLGAEGVAPGCQAVGVEIERAGGEPDVAELDGSFAAVGE